MKGEMKFGPENFEAEREKADALVAQLERRGAVITPERQNVGAFEYQVQFPFEDEKAVVTIFLSLKERQTDSDVVITNMTTLPDTAKSKGLGSRVLEYVLDWANENGLNEVRATQVSNERSQKFWEKNGFKEIKGPNPTGDFVYKKEKIEKSEMGE